MDLEQSVLYWQGNFDFSPLKCLSFIGLYTFNGNDCVINKSIRKICLLLLQSKVTFSNRHKMENIWQKVPARE